MVVELQPQFFFILLVPGSSLWTAPLPIPYPAFMHKVAVA